MKYTPGTEESFSHCESQGRTNTGHWEKILQSQYDLLLTTILIVVSGLMTPCYSVGCYQYLKIRKNRVKV